MTNSIKHPRVQDSSGGGMCPEQHWGTLDDGRVFYFRLRHGWARLNLGPPGTPLENMPLPNPRFNWAEFAAAYDRGENYPQTMFMDPAGYMEITEEDRGWFEDDAERINTFDACLRQVDWYTDWSHLTDKDISDINQKSRELNQP